MSTVIDPGSGRSIRWHTWLGLLTQWVADDAVIQALAPNGAEAVMLCDVLGRTHNGVGDDVMDERDMAGLIVAITERKHVRHAIVRATRNGSSVRARVRALAGVRAEALTLVGD